jgi:acetate kinase
MNIKQIEKKCLQENKTIEVKRYGVHGLDIKYIEQGDVLYDNRNC